MFPPRRIASNHPYRRGTVAFETLLVLPLFLIVILGAVGLADLVIAEQRLDEACGRAARCAALGGSPEEIRACVVAVLGPKCAKDAKIYVGPVGKPGRGEDKSPDYDLDDRDGRGSDDRGHDRDDGIEVHHVGAGELLEVRIELPARCATGTCLAPVRGSEPLLARAVMQRE